MISEARQQKKTGKHQRKQMALELHRQNPNMSIAELARRVGTQPQTIRFYFKEMRIYTEAQSLLDAYYAE